MPASSFISSVFENVIASIVTAVISAGLVSLGLTHSSDLNDPKNWLLWMIITAFALVFLVATGNATRLTVYRWRARRRIRRASGKRLTVLIARFSGDPTGTVQAIVRDSLRQEFGGSVQLIVWPEEVVLDDGAVEDAEDKARRQAQAWLSKKNADILVWGRRKSETVVSLRSTAADDHDDDQVSYELSQDFALPLSAIGFLASAMVTRLASRTMQLVTHDSPKFAGLEDVRAQLRALLADTHTRFSDEELPGLSVMLGDVCMAMHSSVKISDYVEEALLAYESALRLADKRNAADWALLKTLHATAYFMRISVNPDGNMLDIAIKKLTDCVRLAARAIQIDALIRARQVLARALLLKSHIESNRKVAEAAAETISDCFSHCSPTVRRTAWIYCKRGYATICNEIGSRSRDLSWLEEARIHIDDAIRELDPDLEPNQMADALMIKADIVSVIGDIEVDEDVLYESVKLYQAAASKIDPSDRAALGRLNSNLAGTYDTLAQWRHDLSFFNLAGATYRKSLSFKDKVEDPVGYYGTLADMASVLIHIGEIERVPGRFEEAISALRQSTEHVGKDRNYNFWVISQYTLSYALFYLGDLTNDEAKLREAIAICEDVIATGIRRKDRDLWSKFSRNLAKALMAMGDLGQTPDFHKRAIRVLESALSETPKNSSARAWSNIKFDLAKANAWLAQTMLSTKYKARALALLDEAFNASGEYGDAVEQSLILEERTFVETIVLPLQG